LEPLDRRGTILLDRGRDHLLEHQPSTASNVIWRTRCIHPGGGRDQLEAIAARNVLVPKICVTTKRAATHLGHHLALDLLPLFQLRSKVIRELDFGRTCHCDSILEKVLSLLLPLFLCAITLLPPTSFHLDLRSLSLRVIFLCQAVELIFSLIVLSFLCV